MNALCATSLVGFIDGIGGPELMMIMLLILVLFGGKKLPEFARGFGKAMAEFKKATSNVEDEIRKATHNVEEEINSAMVPPAPPPPRTLPAASTENTPFLPSDVGMPAPAPTPPPAEPDTPAQPAGESPSDDPTRPPAA